MPDIFSADKRRLTFPLTNAKTDFAQTPDETPINDTQITWQTTDNDEKVDITLRLSLNEFVALSSAIDVGMDIAFGEDAISIWWLWTTRLLEGGAMTCEDIADCIETNEDVLAALLQQLAANGFAKSGNNASPTDVTLSPSKSAENLLPADYSCSDAQLMATARTIVQKFDEFAQDFFDAIEFMTNPLELTDIVTDSVPGVSATGDVAAFVDFMVQSLREAYLASYNQASENEIACELYCLMQVDCELSYDMLIEMYSTLSVVEYPAPSDLNDFQSIVDWLQGLDLEIGVATVAAFHLFMALAMKFGSGTIFELAGLVGLKTVIDGSVGLLDNSWIDCDCASETPTDYWCIFQDFRLGLGNFYIPTGQGTLTVDGVRSTTSGVRNFASVAMNAFGASFNTRAVIIDAQGYGHIGNGTNDINRVGIWANPTAGSGAEAVLLAQSFIVDNGNELIFLRNDNGVSSAGQSFHVVVSGSGTLLYPTRFNTIKRVALYGLCNVGQVKPVQAIYVNAIPNPVVFPS